MRLRGIIGLAIGGLVLVACAGGPAEMRVAVDLSVAADVNPNGAGRPTPVTVAAFLLTDRDAFEAASVEDLFGDSRSVLGSTLAAESVAPAAPDSRSRFELSATSSARFLAVVVDGVDNGAPAKAIAELRPGRDAGATAQIRRDGLRLRAGS